MLQVVACLPRLSQLFPSLIFRFCSKYEINIFEYINRCIYIYIFIHIYVGLDFGVLFAGVACAECRYCSHFLKGVKCQNPDCSYLHQLGSGKDRSVAAPECCLWRLVSVRGPLFFSCSDGRGPPAAKAVSILRCCLALVSLLLLLALLHSVHLLLLLLLLHLLQLHQGGDD